MKRFGIGRKTLFNSELIDFIFIEYGCDEGQHTHDSTEVVYIVGGNGEEIVNGNVIKAEAGTMIIMNKNCIHSFNNTVPLKYYNIMFSPLLLGEDMDSDTNFFKTIFKKMGFTTEVETDYICIHFKEPSKRAKMQELFRSIMREGVKGEQGSLYAAKVKLEEILLMAARNYESSNIPNEYSSVFGAVMEYIDAHCTEKLMLPEVAKRFGYDKDYFSRIIKKNCNMSFKQLIINKRVSKTLYYVWNTNENVESIMEKCGFTNKTFFYKTFSKIVGLPPKAVRDIARNYYAYMKVCAKMDIEEGENENDEEDVKNKKK